MRSYRIAASVYALCRASSTGSDILRCHIQISMCHIPRCFSLHAGACPSGTSCQLPNGGCGTSPPDGNFTGPAPAPDGNFTAPAPAPGPAESPPPSSNSPPPPPYVSPPPPPPSPDSPPPPPSLDPSPPPPYLNPSPPPPSMESDPYTSPPPPSEDSDFSASPPPSQSFVSPSPGEPCFSHQRSPPQKEGSAGLSSAASSGRRLCPLLWHPSVAF